MQDKEWNEVLYWYTSVIFYKNPFLKMKVHHCHHRSSQTDPALRQFNPVCISKASLGWNSILKVFSHLHLTGPISCVPPATTVCIPQFNTLHCGEFNSQIVGWCYMFKWKYISVINKIFYQDLDYSDILLWIENYLITHYKVISHTLKTQM